MSRSAVVRADVGRNHGLGHLQRGVALAEGLAQKQFEPTLALVGEEPESDIFHHRRFRTIVYPDDPGTPTELAWLRHHVEESKAEVVVVDSYVVDQNYLDRLKETQRRLVVVDDLPRLDYRCDVVVGPHPYAEELPYRGSATTSFLLGSRYVLLRHEFWNPPPSRTFASRSATLLVTLGGADPHNLSLTLARHLVAVDGVGKILVVAGPFLALSDGSFQSATGDVELVRAPPSIYPFLNRCDIAVSSGGQTLLELAAMGIPSVSIEVADNQHDNVLALAQAGTTIAVGKADDARLLDAVAAEVHRLCFDHALRSRMSVAGQRLIDGRGAVRVADAVASIAGRS